MQVVTNLDRELWRKFVDDHPLGNVFHTPEIFDVYTRTKGHQPAVWAELDAESQILALFLPIQITVLDRPLLRKMTTRAVAYGSLLCACIPEWREVLDLLLQTYNQKMKKQVLFTELRNLSDTCGLQPVLSKNGMAYEEHLNFLIDLTQPKSAIWNAIQSNAQRNVRKARKSGVEIGAAENLEDVTAAYAILQKVYKRIQVPLPDQSLFQAAFEIMQPKGMFKIFLARIEGVEVGALTLLLYKGAIIYWYTGTLREFSSYRPSDLLVWHALEWGSENGFHTFDFGGGGRPDEEYGVRDFKLKFGGRQVNFGRNVRVHAPFKLQLSKWGYQILRGIIS